MITLECISLKIELIYKVCTDRIAIKALNKIGKRKSAIEKYRLAKLNKSELIFLLMNLNRLICKRTFKSVEQMNRVNLKKLKIQQSNEKWSKEQDIYLIENNHLAIEVLSEKLNFTHEEIMERRKILGLIRRAKQLKKLQF